MKLTQKQAPWFLSIHDTSHILVIFTLLTIHNYTVLRRLCCNLLNNSVKMPLNTTFNTVIPDLNTR